MDVLKTVVFMFALLVSILSKSLEFEAFESYSLAHDGNDDKILL